MFLAQTSSREALPGNAVSENRGLQAGRPSQERTIARPPDCGVSRAAAEARSGSAMGDEAATPTSDIEGQYEAPRNRRFRDRAEIGPLGGFLRLERGGIGRPAIPTSGGRKMRPEVRNRRDPIQGGGAMVEDRGRRASGQGLGSGVIARGTRGWRLGRPQRTRRSDSTRPTSRAPLRAGSHASPI